jgi:hypothetical protein
MIPTLKVEKEPSPALLDDNNAQRRTSQLSGPLASGDDSGDADRSVIFCVSCETEFANRAALEAHEGSCLAEAGDEHSRVRSQHAWLGSQQQYAPSTSSRASVAAHPMAGTVLHVCPRQGCRKVTSLYYSLSKYFSISLSDQIH